MRALQINVYDGNREHFYVRGCVVVVSGNVQGEAKEGHSSLGRLDEDRNGSDRGCRRVRRLETAVEDGTDRNGGQRSRLLPVPNVSKHYVFGSSHEKIQS